MNLNFMIIPYRFGLHIYKYGQFACYSYFDFGFACINIVSNN